MSGKVYLEDRIEHSLWLYPELIDDSLFGIRPGMAVLGERYPTVYRQDVMPGGRRADLVFVEPHRVTVAELKKDSLHVSGDPNTEDVVDQVVDYLHQCLKKYPDRSEYRGFVIGTGIRDRDRLERKIQEAPFPVTPLIFGRDIPSAIRFCTHCRRAVAYDSRLCPCGAKRG